MTERRSNVVPFVDYRERWPIDYSAARDDAPDHQADAGPPPAPLPEFIRREAAAYQRQLRRDHRARVVFAGLVALMVLGAFGFAVRGLILATRPYPPLAASGAPRPDAPACNAAECPSAP